MLPCNSQARENLSSVGKAIPEVRRINLAWSDELPTDNEQGLKAQSDNPKAPPKVYISATGPKRMLP